jgi:hypothetical protein
MGYGEAGFPRAFDDAVGDGSRLDVRAARSEKEVVGHDRSSFQRQRKHVFGMFFERGVAREVDEFDRFRQLEVPRFGFV